MEGIGEMEMEEVKPCVETMLMVATGVGGVNKRRVTGGENKKRGVKSEVVSGKSGVKISKRVKLELDFRLDEANTTTTTTETTASTSFDDSGCDDVYAEHLFKVEKNKTTRRKI